MTIVRHYTLRKTQSQMSRLFEFSFYFLVFQIIVPEDKGRMIILSIKFPKTTCLCNYRIRFMLFTLNPNIKVITNK